MFNRFRKPNVLEDAPLDDLFPASPEAPEPYVAPENKSSIFEVLVSNIDNIGELSGEALDARIAKFNQGIVTIELHLRDLHYEKQRRKLAGGDDRLS